MADGPTGLLEKSMLIVVVISAVTLSAGAASSAHSSLISCSAEQNSSTMKIQIPGQNVTGAPKFWDQCQSVDRKETITKLVLDYKPYPIKDIMPG